MAMGMEELAQCFDAEQQINEKLQVKRDHARTFLGRAWQDFRLRGHQQKFEQITDEFDIISLHGLDEGELMR